MAQLIITYKNRKESYAGGMPDELVCHIEEELKKYYHGFINKINAEGGFITVVFDKKTNRIKDFKVESITRTLRAELETALSSRPRPAFSAFDVER